MCGISLREIAAMNFENKRRRRVPDVAADGNRREIRFAPQNKISISLNLNSEILRRKNLPHLAVKGFIYDKWILKIFEIL